MSAMPTQKSQKTKPSITSPSDSTVVLETTNEDYYEKHIYSFLCNQLGVKESTFNPKNFYKRYKQWLEERVIFTGLKCGNALQESVKMRDEVIVPSTNGFNAFLKKQGLPQFHFFLFQDRVLVNSKFTGDHVKSLFPNLRPIPLDQIFGEFNREIRQCKTDGIGGSKDVAQIKY